MYRQLFKKFMIDPFFVVIALGIAAVYKKIKLAIFASLIYAVFLLLHLYSGEKVITFYYDSIMLIMQAIFFIILAGAAYLQIKLNGF